MKHRIFLIVILLIGLSGCDLREREDALQQRAAALNEKEQQLLLKEKSLELKEEELNRRQQQMDSTTVADSTAIVNPALVGTWSVQMTCTETTCAGSAIGDTKTETWEISYQDRNVIAKARVANELVRVYSGTFNGSTLELVETTEAAQQSVAKILVRLQVTADNQMEGTREIDRMSEACRIVYAMNMQKK
jgi:hypothetical protein